MIVCSLGKTNSVRITRALSGLTFCEASVTVSAYSDSSTFTLSTGGPEEEYVVTGSELYTTQGEEPQLKVTGMLSSQSQWLDPNPCSYDATKIRDALKNLGIDGGSDTPVTFLSLALTRGQLAITLANMGSEPTFVDFEHNVAKRYADYYKEKPVNPGASFRRTIGRPPVAAYLGTDEANYADFPEMFQTLLPFGMNTDLDRLSIENLARNLNALSSLMADLQAFSSPNEYPLGTTVLSPITYDRKVIVASQSDYAENASFHSYYCA